jgi:hypothetical protein
MLVNAVQEDAPAQLAVRKTLKKKAIVVAVVRGEDYAPVILWLAKPE